MAKDEEEEVGKGDARRAREGGFGSVRGTSKVEGEEAVELAGNR